MNLFISCDWGTSNFRIRLADAARREAISEVWAPEGVSEVYGRWQASGLRPEDRIGFYQAVLGKGIEALRRQTPYSLTGLPVVLTGMASSSLGMMELPYRRAPFELTGTELVRVSIPASEHFGHQTLLVSGVRTGSDVMRGEETQLIGCAPAGYDERMYILPGTHSKHVRVKVGRALDVTTYMTGEFFQLLASKSILSLSVAAAVSDGGAVSEGFLQGVRESQQSGILRNAFGVRTRQVLGGIGKEENYHFLSGLLIGEELKSLAGTELPIVVVAAGRMKEYYVAACEEFGFPDVCVVDSDQAIVRGHCRLLELGEGGG